MGSIYWITSYPKSGNTWMRMFLSHLVLEKSSKSFMNQLQSFAPDENSAKFYQAVSTIPLALLDDKGLAKIRPAAQQVAADAVDGYLFMKTHHLLGVHHGTPTINLKATAGAIYVVRNPLDVVVSYSEFRKMSIDQTIDKILMSGRALARPRNGSYQLSGSWGEHVDSWSKKPSEYICTVRYEDLVTDPFETFSKVVKFLKVNVPEDQIRYAIDQTSISKLKGEEQKEGFREKPKETTQFFRSGKIGEWKLRLTEQQVQRVTSNFAEPMKRFGYLDASGNIAS